MVSSHSQASHKKSISLHRADENIYNMTRNLGLGVPFGGNLQLNIVASFRFLAAQDQMSNKACIAVDSVALPS